MGLNGTENKQEKGEDLRVCRYPSPDNSLGFVLGDRGALFSRGEEAHSGTEMHTSAGQCSPPRKTHLSMCAARGARRCWARGNLDGAGMETQPRSRGRGRRGKQEGKSLAASWEAGNYGISLPHPVVEPQFVEMKLFCLRIPK